MLTFDAAHATAIITTDVDADVSANAAVPAAPTGLHVHLIEKFLSYGHRV